MNSLYMDYNATRPLRESAKLKILESFDLLGNPSSVHSDGRKARKIIEESREKIAQTLSVKAKQIIFTSGATESNNLLSQQFLNNNFCISSQEHDSLHIPAEGVFECKSDQNGLCDLNHLEDILKKNKISCVSLLSANNETGVIQPILEASLLAKKYNAFFCTDAVQGFGRVQADWNAFDFIILSGHKIGGLPGIGILVMPEDYFLKPILKGGGQERSFRAGTENILGIISMAAVIEEAKNENWLNTQKQKNILEKELIKINPDIVIVGSEQKRLPNTSLFITPGIKSEIQVMNFDLNGISVSAGSACSSGKVKKSRVLKNIGFNDELSSCALRISLMPEVATDHIEYFLKVYEQMYSQCKRKEYHS